MNTYKLLITSADYHGVNFIENIAKYAAKGAVIDKSVHLFNDYPHSCTMDLVTTEFLTSDLNVSVITIQEAWTKEYLDKLEWAEFKAVVNVKVPKGRDRVIMTRQFLEAVGNKEEV
jgi:hypothetical protein